MSNNETINVDNNAYEGRDDVLAQFQELINNYDVDQCLAILNVVDWNIDQAVQLYFQQHQDNESNTQTTTQESATTTTTTTTTDRTTNNNTVATATEEEEDDADMSEHVAHMRKRASLLPNVYSDDKEAVEHFIKEYQNRYGKEGPIPPFYCGTLLDACNKSLFTQKLNERKQLLLYIHDDKPIHSNIFNTQVLCNKDICQYLNQSNSPYLIWPWDMTQKKNELFLFEKLEELKTFFGYQLSDFKTQLNDIKKHLPCLIVLENTNKSVTITNTYTYNEIHAGDVLYFYLLGGADQYEERKANELKQEQEREERQRFKEQQDQEYKRALELDKAKKEQKLKEEQLKRQIEQDIEKRKVNSLAKLPQEPSPSTTTPASSITTIRFRKPTGELLVRKFLISEKLNVILLFIDSLGYFYEDHKLLQQYPRRDLIQENHDSTLEQLKLYPQETLIIEQR